MCLAALFTTCLQIRRNQTSLRKIKLAALPGGCSDWACQRFEHRRRETTRGLVCSGRRSVRPLSCLAAIGSFFCSKKPMDHATRSHRLEPIRCVAIGMQPDSPRLICSNPVVSPRTGGELCDCEKAKQFGPGFLVKFVCRRHAVVPAPDLSRT